MSMRRFLVAITFTAGVSACGGGGGAASPPPTNQVALNVTASGNGSVISQPAGIDCPGQCSAFAPLGSTMVLTAKPASGYVLSAWAGACTGSALSCSVSMNAAQNVSVSFAPASTSSGWSGETALSSAGAGTPQVAIDAGGRALAVWSQLDGAGTTTESIWSSRYTPTSGWSAPVALQSSTGNVSGIYLAMERNSGKAMVAWRQLGSTAYDLWAKAFDPNAGWGPASTVESAPGMVGTASVGLDSSGRAVLAWSQIGPNTRASIYASRSVSSGVWSTPALVETQEVVGVQDTDPKIAVFPDGSASVVWAHATGSATSLWTNTMAASGLWGNAFELVADSGSTQSIGVHNIAADGAGNAMLVWGQMDGNSNAIWFKRYTPGGWQSVIAPVAAGTTGSNVISTPTLSMNARGTAQVLWALTDGTVFAASAAPGQPFGSRFSVRSSDTSTLNALPAVGLDDLDNAKALWSETNGNLYLSSRSGSVWASPSLHESQPDRADQPHLAVNERGNAVAVWRQYVAGSGTRIFARQFSSGR